MKQPIYQYVLAVTLGTIIIFLPDIQPVPFVLAIIYLVSGLLFGFLWPALSSRWGYWISGPMVVLMGLSGIFSGYFESFLKNDVPVMVIGVIAACVGSWAGMWLKRRRRTNSQ